MKLKKILSVFLVLTLFVNVSFAFDPYADEEVEKKSYKKLYYGIALTLLGGFLTYDGFSMEKVDVSKPSVDYTTVLHSEWIQPIGIPEYHVRSGYTNNDSSPGDQEFSEYKIGNKIYTIEKNILYNNGNVDLHDITIEVRYKHDGNIPINDGSYHVALSEEYKPYTGLTLEKGKSLEWQDLWKYESGPQQTENTGIKPDNAPAGNQRTGYSELTDGVEGLNLGKDAFTLMDIRIVLKKNKQYKPIYEKRHKSDIEGVAGILIGVTGIYFIVDHFLDMHKFNAYAKRHNLNLKVATASNGYKLMLQKRI